ncbi:MAG: hypothetical protein QOF30_694 [Acidimicrobiaceae bacterium]|jgi:hypothetical protein|nr:hypothetical protein [Acidimicrobiaceae bacterium]
MGYFRSGTSKEATADASARTGDSRPDSTISSHAPSDRSRIPGAFGTSAMSQGYVLPARCLDSQSNKTIALGFFGSVGPAGIEPATKGL